VTSVRTAVQSDRFNHLFPSAEIVRAFVEQHNAEQIELCGWCEFVDKKKNEKRVICLGQYRIWLLKPPAKGKKAEVPLLRNA
jgi:hypothetical protein